MTSEQKIDENGQIYYVISYTEEEIAEMKKRQEEKESQEIQPK